MAQLPHIVRAPAIARATARHKHGQTRAAYLQIVDVQCFGALDAMGCVELAESALAPDEKVAVGGQRSGKGARSDLYHSTEGQFLQKSWQRAPFRSLPRAKLSFPIRAKGIHFTFLRQYNCVFLATGRFGNFIRHTLNIEWCQFISSGAEAQLALLASAAHEKPAYVVDEGGMVAACANQSDLSPIVLVEIDRVRSECYLSSIAGTTLPKVIIAPGKHITRPRHYKCVRLPT